MISYLKSQYEADIRDQITFIQRFPSQGDVGSFEAISKELKAFLKHIKVGENMSLQNKALFGEWLSLTGEAFRRDKFIKDKDLPQRFEDWIYRECEIKKQTIHY